MSKTEVKTLVEKHVREALAIRANKKVSEATVKKVMREVLRAAEKSVKAA
jgi:hypothetical protein